MVRAEEKYDVAVTIEVVKIGEILLAGFMWKWKDCLVDFCVRPSFSKPLAQFTCYVVCILSVWFEL